ncbi:hypothetical protein [Clostridium sp. C2-6-12]|uniref:hypothetical protein n=1 Tax=Clostridium sp. C2-6-12 TaxID=2698832 RepID=UPI001368FDD8|nr:hypothetical protein [Clostridium sp. C2-6-12]
MSIRFISVLGLLILMIALMYSTLGSGITLVIFTIMFLAMAILFTIKQEYHDKYLSFINPGLYRTYREKGDAFLRKKRNMNIISYYIISVMMGFNSFMEIKLMDRKPIFDFGQFISFALVVFIAMIIINYVSILIAKKSENANKDLGLNIIIGIAFAILLIGFVSFSI